MPDYRLADQSPLEWDDPPSEQGTSPQSPLQYPHAPAVMNDELEYLYERSKQSTAQVSKSNVQEIADPQLQKSANIAQEPGAHNANDLLTGIDETGTQNVESTQRRAEDGNAREEDLLIPFFTRESEPTFEDKQALATVLKISVGRVDNWYREQRLAAARSLPSIRVNDNPQQLQIDEDGDGKEQWLKYCFDKNPEPTFGDKCNLAKLLAITIVEVDEWHRQNRLGLQTTSLASPLLGIELDGGQTAGNDHEQVDKNGNELPREISGPNSQSLHSTAPISNSLGSATFSLPQTQPAPGLDAYSAISQITTTTSSIQSNIRFKCTFPGCKINCKSLAAQVRHEHEVHWRVKYFPCLLCSIYCVTGGFQCRFCNEIFQELHVIEQHILNPCDLPELIKISPHRSYDARKHQMDHHPSTSESNINGRHQCSFCSRDFDQSEDATYHECDRKAAWKEHQRVQALFDAEGHSTISFQKRLETWVLHTPEGYPHKWPPECCFPTCSETFDSLHKRAAHFDETHHVHSPTVLKRGFSDSGIEYNDEDGSNVLANHMQPRGRARRGNTVSNARSRRLPSHLPVKLSAQVRNLDLVGVGGEKPHGKPP